jgi:hypothetical protein
VFQQVIACDQYGENSVVLEWLPTERGKNKYSGANDSTIDAVTCQISCYECGIRIQRSTPPAPKSR